jgi:hypothetical protein
VADESVPKKDGVTNTVASNPRQAHLAFERKLPEMLAIPDDLLPPINFDAIVVANSILTAAPRIKAKRHLLEKVQPFDIRWVDDIEDCGLTLVHSQAIVRFAEESLSGADLEFLMEQHAGLIRDAVSLEGRKLLDPVKVDKLPRSTTQDQVGHDVLGIVNVFLSAWPQIEGRCPSTKAELEHVRERANLYVLATTTKGEQQTSLSEALLNRKRAAYLGLRAYRKIRYGLLLVLDDQEKVDEIAPPLGRSKRKARKGATTEGQTQPSQNAADDEDDLDDDLVDDPASAAPVAAAPAARAAASAVRVGMPGSPPTQEGAE